MGEIRKLLAESEMFGFLQQSEIQTVFQHCSGIGPSRERELWQMGIKSWKEYLEAFPFQNKSALFNSSVKRWVLESITRYKAGDLYFFIKNFPQRHHLKILQDHWKKCSFFDLETTGLDPMDRGISVICLYHMGNMYRFIEGQNLDDFLEILPEIEILVSFNGSSFDVPVVLDFFNIPELPCCHLDLRWIAYHQGLRGGLKQIEKELGFYRAEELNGVDGWEAVRLWDFYLRYQDLAALKKLVDYCEKDVESLVHLGRYLINQCKVELKLRDQ